MKIAVVDTNVVVAGLGSRQAESPPRRVLDAMLVGHVRYAVSAALLAEYREVLLRPKLRQFLGLSPVQVEVVVRRLAQGAALRSPIRAAADAPDPGDQFLLDLALDLPQAVLVTGDKLLFALQDLGIQVLSPAEFAATLGNEPPQS
ncbi:MAG: putative toxin-antitoxin system toxin component, PIN family [Deltaproteobacteria bacterium]|nr:putative toxin-antitoxin system toxin component, PIN family [Deltaproteobacteria bacterium]